MNSALPGDERAYTLDTLQLIMSWNEVEYFYPGVLLEDCIQGTISNMSVKI